MLKSHSSASVPTGSLPWKTARRGPCGFVRDASPHSNERVTHDQLHRRQRHGPLDHQFRRPAHPRRSDGTHRTGLPTLELLRQDPASREPHTFRCHRAHADERPRDLLVQVRQRPSLEPGARIPDGDRVRCLGRRPQRLSTFPGRDDAPHRPTDRCHLGDGRPSSRPPRLDDDGHDRHWKSGGIPSTCDACRAGNQHFARVGHRPRCLGKVRAKHAPPRIRHHGRLEFWGNPRSSRHHHHMYG